MINFPPPEWWKNKTFHQLSLGCAGGTFVDWSINFLLGKTTNNVVHLHGCNFAEIPQNPLIKFNGTAHQHPKNHPSNVGTIIWQGHMLHLMSPNAINTFYFCLTADLFGNKFCDHNYLYLEKNLDATSTFFLTHDYIPRMIVYPDFSTAAPYLHNRWLRIIRGIPDINGFHNENSPYQIKNNGEIWNLRELLSISIAKDHNKWRHICDAQNELQNRLKNNMAVPLSSIFTNLDDVLKEAGERFEILQFNWEKFAAWLEIYQQWKNNNSEFTWFFNLDKLVNAIIKERNIPVGKIDTLQECALEAELMLNGWSIKNYGLKRFPSQSTDIKIEPLIHKF